MATVTRTSIDPFIPELWSAEVLLARTEAHFMAERVMGVMKVGLKKGDLVHIPFIGNLNVNAVGTDGTISPQGPTETEFSVLVNRWIESSVDVSEDAQDELGFDIMPKYSKKIGHALGRDVEDQLVALYPTLFTNNQFVTDTVNLTRIQIMAGTVMLDEADVPDEDRFMIVRSSQRGELLLITEFTSRDFVEGKPVVSRVLGEIFGMPVLRSNRVVRNDYDGDAIVESVNLMWHIEAFGIAMQQTPKTLKLAKTKLSDTVVGHHRYGVNNIRINHAVILGTDTS